MNDSAMFEDVIAELRSGFDQVHYQRPRPPRPRTASTLGWAAAAAAAAAAAVSVAVWAGVAGEEIAWAAEARKPTAAEQAWITDDCLNTVVAQGKRELPALMASEVRGNTATSTFAGGGWFVTCVVEDLTRDDDIAPFVSVAQWSNVDEFSPQGDGPLRFSAFGLAPGPMEATTFVTGTVGSDVDRVTISVPELGEVEATVANGWFTAWWPSQDGFQIRAIDPNGDQIAEVVVP